MALSNELVSQFAKIVNPQTTTKKESVVYGTAKKIGNQTYVQLDGSELSTPVNTTADVKDGDRVTVMIKNHTAIITGDISDPSARKEAVQELGDKIAEFDTVIADKVVAEIAQFGALTAESAVIKDLKAKDATLENLISDKVSTSELEAERAEIDELIADKISVENFNAEIAEIDNLIADKADIKDLEAYTLKSTYAEFVQTTTDTLKANDASIKNLETTKLSAESADILYANIDFSNIKMAAVEELFTKSGIIKNLVVGDTSITGELVGVTIKGDLIEGNTIKADKLVVKGEDGLYYKLNVDSLGETTASSDTKYQNGLDGSVIIAKSITATKVDVKDLVAFDATIGGFKITENSLYSGAKASVGNTTRGIYLDNDGQMAIGDSSNYIKYYKDTDGSYKLAVSAKSIVFGASAKSVEDAFTEVNDKVDNIEIGGRNYISNSAFLNGSTGWSCDPGVTVDNTTLFNNRPTLKIEQSGFTADEFGGATISRLPIANSFSIQKSETITISFYYYLPTLEGFDSANLNMQFAGTKEGSSSSSAIYQFRCAKDSLVVGQWTRVEIPITAANNYTKCYINTYINRNGLIWLADFKLEKGNKATDWSPAPEDTLTDINNAVNSIELGGRNHISNSAFLNGSTGWNCNQGVTVDSTTLFNNHPTLKMDLSGLTNDVFFGARTSRLPFEKSLNIQSGEKLMLTFYYYLPNLDGFDSENFHIRLNGIKEGATSSSAIYHFKCAKNNLVVGAWTKVEIPITATANYTECDIWTYINRNGLIWLADFKLEKGSKATDWTPAPEDTLTDINNAVNSIEIGGRNLVLRSNNERTWGANDANTQYVSNLYTYSDYANQVLHDGSVEQITVSYDWVTTFTSCKISVQTGWKVWSSFATFSVTESNQSGHCEYVYTIPSSWLDCGNSGVRILVTGYSEIGELTITNFKLEIGNKATTWTPAPEDVDEGIQNAQNSGDKAQADLAETNNRLNAAELRIDTLEGQIVLTTTDEDGTTSLIQNGSGWTFNLDSLASQVDNTSDAVGALEDGLANESEKVEEMGQTVNALKDLPGRIYVGTTDDGDPCIEICQDSTQTKIQITDDAINFVAGSSIPAYIVNDETEGSKLKIEHAEVTDELAFGGFSWKVRSNGNMGLIWKG